MRKRKPKAPATAVQPRDRFTANRERFKAVANVAGQFDKWRPATEVLTRVQAVPTIFPQLDVATRIMGWPVSRFGLVHGPSGEGKTAFVLGLMLSFLQRGHFAAFIDAERTTPVDWVEVLMGEVATYPGFRALPLPNNSYEEARSGVRQWAEVIGNARAKGDLPDDVTGICVVDSIRKLVPKNLWDKLSKELAADADDKPKKGRRAQKPKGIDGAGGRAAQIKAALNAQWMDELVPLLADTRTSVVVIARETDNDSIEFGADDFKVGGGKALNYESSLRARVQSDYLKHPDDYNLFVGNRHMMEVYKTKVGGRVERRPRCFFHTSNGILSPAGFDLARDVLELAKNVGVVKQAGSSYRYDGKSLGMGELKALDKLRADYDLMHQIEMEARNKASEGW